MANLACIIWIIWTIAIWVIYHKVFTVYYFNLGQGIMKELLFAAFIGMFMAGLTLYLWWLTAIIIILVGLANKGKTGNSAHIVLAIILVIVISIVGIWFNSSRNSSNSSANAVTTESVIEYMV